MDLPLLGVSIRHGELATLRDWIFAHQRAIEIQDFVFPGVIAGDTQPIVDAYRHDLAGHSGARGIHGPFFGLDLGNPDAEMRAIMQRRFIKALELAESLAATQMVVHSPFTYWHALNRINYAFVRPLVFESAAECLAPVLVRARDIGCTLVLENIDDTDPTDRVELARAINHPALKISIDTGHAELAHGRYGAPPVVDFVAAAGDLLDHLHLQDADGYADRHWHPGEGRIPWAPVFNAIRQKERAPRLILEVRDRAEQLPQSVARLEARGLAA